MIKVQTLLWPFVFSPTRHSSGSAGEPAPVSPSRERQANWSAWPEKAQRVARRAPGLSLRCSLSTSRITKKVSLLLSTIVLLRASRSSAHSWSISTGRSFIPSVFHNGRARNKVGFSRLCHPPERIVVALRGLCVAMCPRKHEHNSTGSTIWSPSRLHRLATFP